MNIYKEIFLMQQTYATLFSLTNKLQVEGDKYYDKLTSRQYMAMMVIAHLNEDQTTLNNIAKKLGTTKQSVKQLITILENKGYVITVPSQQDKRAVNVKITESGKKVMLEGGELSLLLTSRYPIIKKVVAFAPHAYCFQGLNYKNVSSWSYV